MLMNMIIWRRTVLCFNKRKKTTIIRYFVNKKADDDEHIKSIMLLFHPFRNEVKEVHNIADIHKKYLEYKGEVDAERAKFEPNPDFMDILDNINIEEEEKDKEEEEGESLE